MSKRIIDDRLDNIQTATQNFHNRKIFNAFFYQSKFRTGKMDNSGPGVVIDEFGITIYNNFGVKVIFYDINGGIWIDKAGVLTQIQTFDDGSGHNVLYV